MTRKLLFLPLIILFISCTVTKRVHRRGFHIQWNKIERTQSAEKKSSIPNEVQRDNSNQEIASHSKKVNPIDSTSVESNDELARTSTLSPKPKKNALTTLHPSITENLNFESILSAKKKSTRVTSHTSSRPIFWRMSAKSLKNIGLVLIWIGAMLLFASLLAQLGAFSSSGDGGGGAWLNFFLDLTTISGWFWLLVFVIVFALVAYLFFLLVIYVLGGPIVGAIVGLSILALGIFFYTLGKKREIEP
ncbi:MAG: hypothetical protein HRT58_01985 [Crocinitomicaceae bacterium]|nr:hypothetical protein [Flavobacteriales bacterium]NQZ34396.1 hypothetical protein [Crocinitomicaceae bacterium]